MVALPGKSFKANPTATGHVPVYKANGMLAYLVTMGTLIFLFQTGRSVCLLPVGHYVGVSVGVHLFMRLE